MICTLERLTNSVCSGKRTPDDSAPLAKTVNHSSDMLYTEDCKWKGDSSRSNLSFRACQHLIDLLCWMPKGNFSSRSFSLYTTHVLKLERYAFFCSFLALFSYQRCQNIMFLSLQDNIELTCLSLLFISLLLIRL